MAESDRGFASMDVNVVKRIASDGGKAGHQYGTARQWTPDEARAAGRLGAQRSAEAKRRRKAAGAAAR